MDERRPPGDTDGARPTTRAESGSAPSSSTIGPYRILQKLGEGGMGEVYEAQQDEPVRRRVALKLIKPGMDTRQVIARFESERQALAMMNHPGIARVFDAGETPEGRPFFAMEFVKGVPLTEYCDMNRLSTPERLELFMSLCEGVQHAHQKGIIHRDLKPSNVLVRIQDEEPVPKIIDFGVAKATQQRLTEKTVYTQLGALVGTPEYMSPEQAEMTGLDVDTRTDVYSLGVMLYELLVGALPFDSKQLRAAGFDEIRRRIREEEPTKPSTRLSTLGDRSVERARERGTDRRTLQRQLSGDLDWITMKALEKDRARRYGSAAELADDVRRHLRHEPVIASPPSVVYRVGKFVRRHRLGVAAAAMVFLALVLGVTGVTLGLLRAKRAEAVARQEAATAGQVSDFLVGLFEVSDPGEARGNTITAREIMDKGAEQIRDKLQDQPLVQGRLMNVMGHVYESLGLYEEAQSLQESALSIQRRRLGADDPATLSTLSDLGVLQQKQGNFDKSIELLSEAYEGLLTELGDSHIETARAMMTLGLAYHELGNLGEAERLLQPACETLGDLIGADDTYTLVCRNNLAMVYRATGRGRESMALHSEILERRRRLLGDDHPHTILSMSNLASDHQDAGELETSRMLFAEALEQARRVWGNDHDHTQAIQNNLALVHKDLGRFDEAATMYLELIESMKRNLGEGHPGSIVTRGNLGDLYTSMGRLDDAERLLERVVEEVASVFPPRHVVTGFTHRKYGACLTGQRRFEEAESHLLRAHEILVELGGPDHVQTLRAVDNLVELYESWGRESEAAGWRAKRPAGIAG